MIGNGVRGTSISSEERRSEDAGGRGWRGRLRQCSWETFQVRQVPPSPSDPLRCGLASYLPSYALLLALYAMPLFPSAFPPCSSLHPSY